MQHLTDEQIKAWEKEIKEVEKFMEKMGWSRLPDKNLWSNGIETTNRENALNDALNRGLNDKGWFKIKTIQHYPKIGNIQKETKVRVRWYLPKANRVITYFDGLNVAILDWDDNKAEDDNYWSNFSNDITHSISDHGFKIEKEDDEIPIIFLKGEDRYHWHLYTAEL